MIHETREKHERKKTLPLIIIEPTEHTEDTEETLAAKIREGTRRKKVKNLLLARVKSYGLDYICF